MSLFVALNTVRYGALLKTTVGAHVRMDSHQTKPNAGTWANCCAATVYQRYRIEPVSAGKLNLGGIRENGANSPTVAFLRGRLLLDVSDLNQDLAQFGALL